MLYPIGVMGEVASIWLALPLVRARGVLTATRPNAWNCSFNYYGFLMVRAGELAWGNYWVLVCQGVHRRLPGLVREGAGAPGLAAAMPASCRGGLLRH